MKKYIIILAITIIQFPLFSQNLISKYKTGTVKLVPDIEYAQDNDWNSIFRSYYDTLYNKPMGMRKSLVVLPDGSLIVNHAYRDYHTKFSPTGKYEKEFTIEKAGHKAIMGVINDNTLFTGLDNMGKMTCSDFNGKYKKTLTLNYMTKDIIALNNGKFAVVGWVIWSEKFRTFISIVDYETNKEKVIWEHFDDREISSDGKKLKNRPPFNYSIKLNEGGMISCTTMPYSKQTGKGLPPQITTVKNKLIVAIPNTGEILVYDLEGNFKSKSAINWNNNTISVEEQKTIQQKAIDDYKAYIEKGDKRVQNNLEAYKNMISEMEEDLRKINTPIAKPSFSNIIKDSDGNVLFFEIPEEKDANIFHVWVYNQVGEFPTKCTFICDDYDLNISTNKMVFKDGYIYGLQTLKETNGNPLRLVRFKLKTN
ncbi:MAG: hypothetical protein JW717_00790 [Marinilabiliaceae bacterium]|nr:hypothetical protein [Marinilabiliaceae bacterium]